MRRKILLFIPMYNCEKQIIRVLKQLTPLICQYLFEVIIINNCSTDKGEQTVQSYLQNNAFWCPLKILRNDDNYGLGGSHKVVFQYAIQNGYDYLIVLHGDDQGSIDNLLPYLEKETYQQYDCFLGARFMKNSRLKGYSVFRTLGNYVYNFLFSIGTGMWVSDLGSGLNMYKVDILKNGFYKKYKDNLMFNYCMILGSAYYHHKVKFFPILWREDDQVSNVKMVNQAIVVLKLLFSYMFDHKKFVTAEHRDKIIDDYTAQCVFSSSGR
jgi:glycosyltransferase involved in cell wall biosynthesis